MCVYVTCCLRPPQFYSLLTIEVNDPSFGTTDFADRAVVYWLNFFEFCQILRSSQTPKFFWKICSLLLCFLFYASVCNVSLCPGLLQHPFPFDFQTTGSLSKTSPCEKRSSAPYMMFWLQEFRHSDYMRPRLFSPYVDEVKVCSVFTKYICPG